MDTIQAAKLVFCSTTGVSAESLEGTKTVKVQVLFVRYALSGIYDETLISSSESVEELTSC